jgi:hypothetical protein
VETDLSRLIGQVNELQGLLTAFLEIFHKLGSCVYSLMLRPLQSGVWCRFAVYGTTRGRRRQCTFIALRRQCKNSGGLPQAVPHGAG